MTRVTERYNDYMLGLLESIRRLVDNRTHNPDQSGQLIVIQVLTHVYPLIILQQSLIPPAV